MSSETVTATIAGATPAQPTIEESHAALVEEGVLSADGEGANTEVTPDSEKGTANDDAPKSLAKFRKEDGSIDVEALEKSYLELERKQSGAPADTDEDPEDTDGEPEAKLEVTKEPTPEETAKVKDIAEKAEVNLAELSQEWLSNGELTAEHYEKLEAQGYPREMVDTYAKGLTSDVAAIASEAISVAGGNEQYGEMIDWAIENLSEAEQAAFDKAVDSKDKATVLQAVRGLNAQYVNATNDGTVEPSEQLSGKTGNNNSAYKHMDDYMADLDDPRYQTSETFRAKVMEKLGRSNI